MLSKKTKDLNYGADQSARFIKCYVEIGLRYKDIKSVLLNAVDVLQQLITSEVFIM